jgi:hypothetical protein
MAGYSLPLVSREPSSSDSPDMARQNSLGFAGPLQSEEGNLRSVVGSDIARAARNAEKPIFLFLIISSGILVHVNNGTVGGAACPCKVGKRLLDDGDEVCFLARKFGLVHASWADSNIGTPPQFRIQANPIADHSLRWKLSRFVRAAA